MSTELYRKYLNIIEENSQPKIQLDEGFSDWLKSKVSGLVDKFFNSSPRAKKAYQQAMARKNDLANILKTSRSAEEAKKKVESLAKADATQMNEGFENHPGQTAFGVASTLGGTATLILNTIYDKMSEILAIPIDTLRQPDMVNSVFADERLPDLVLNYGVPIMAVIYGLTLLYYVGKSDDR